MSRALTPLEEALVPFRCQAATQVAHGKKPALTAVLAILIRWPDLSLAQHLVQGFPIVGDLFTIRLDDQETLNRPPSTLSKQVIHLLHTPQRAAKALINLLQSNLMDSITVQRRPAMH